jgi:hypothetical protein
VVVLAKAICLVGQTGFPSPPDNCIIIPPTSNVDSLTKYVRDRAEGRGEFAARLDEAVKNVIMSFKTAFGLATSEAIDIDIGAGEAACLDDVEDTLEREVACERVHLLQFWGDLPLWHFNEVPFMWDLYLDQEVTLNQSFNIPCGKPIADQGSSKKSKAKRLKTVSATKVEADGGSNGRIVKRALSRKKKAQRVDSVGDDDSDEDGGGDADYVAI